MKITMPAVRQGFTLIELLVVIGIMAVLMAGVVALIDPVDKNRQAADSQMQSLVAQAATAEESYAATHNGCYATSWANLNTAGELKTTTANVPNSTYAQPQFSPGAVGSCPAGEVSSAVICVTLQAKRWNGATVWQYDTSTGKTCNRAGCSGCP